MEWIKKNWYWLLVAPVVGYFLYQYYTAKKDEAEKMQKVREAKAVKGVVREMEAAND